MVASTTIALAVAVWIVAGICLYFSQPLAQLLCAGNDPVVMVAGKGNFNSDLMLSVLTVPFSITARSGTQLSIDVEAFEGINEHPAREYPVRSRTKALHALRIALGDPWLPPERAHGGSAGLHATHRKYSLAPAAALLLAGIRACIPLFPALDSSRYMPARRHQLDRLLIKYWGTDSFVKELANSSELTGADQWLGIDGLGSTFGFLMLGAVCAPLMRIWQPNVSSGREKGEEDTSCDYRKGADGYFALKLGYEADPNCTLASTKARYADEFP